MKVFTGCSVEMFVTLHLLKRKDRIIADYEEGKREKKNEPNKPLSEVFADIMEEEDLTMPCLMCNR